jgi:hypothetical protein
MGQVKFSTIIADERGQVSHKRVLSIIGMLVLCTSLIIGSILPNDYRPAPELITAVEVIVSVCIGSTTLDKFSYRQPLSNDNTE